MAGIYIHIPFCKQACHYCNFHFSTNMNRTREMTSAIIKEIEKRSVDWQDTAIDTIYFGGGTPSILPIQQVEQLLAALHRHFSINKDAEITFEANPDDMKGEKYAQLKTLGINRLSIGIQSFSDYDLKWMNRAHTTTEAEECINKAVQGGFRDFSADLIYGLPHQSGLQWLDNLNKITEYPVNHLSCYALTVEEKTALAHMVSKGIKNPVNEDLQNAHYDILLTWAEKNHFEAYEISNFAKEKNYSRHNTAYWFGEKYLGLGPGAHSYDGKTRYFNIENNALYLSLTEHNQSVCETEDIDEKTAFNELIMTRLRTIWGIPEDLIAASPFADNFIKSVHKWIADEKVIYRDNAYKLTREGLFWADGIAADLFIL